jgi:hypothetical protein
MGGEPGQIVDRLDEVGLALAIATQERGDTRIQRDIDVVVGAEVVEDQLRDVQGGRPQAGSGLTSPPGGGAVSTACPPNWLRMAAIAFIAGESSWRDTKRA